MSLQSLSNSEVLSRLQDLVRREREVTLLVLLHLNELERRKLHLKLGYSSLFDYCTSKLGYSVSAAARRIKTARCLARFPQVYDLLEKNELNMSTVAQVSGALTAANHEELIGRIRGKSQREVEAILAEYQTCSMPRDRVRTVVMRVPAAFVQSADASRGISLPALDLTGNDSMEASPGPMSTDARAHDACEKSAYFRNGSDSRDESISTLLISAPDEIEKRIAIQFSVHLEFMSKLNRIKSLVWHRLPANASLEQVFELVMDIALEKEDPGKRTERRKCRIQKTNKRNDRRAATSVSNHQEARHIPARVRDEIFARDRNQCTFVGAGGRRCNATSGLQVDHIKPVARGGASTSNNLRILCAYHNRLEAERLLGSGVSSTRRTESSR